MANEFTTPPVGTLTQLSTPSISDKEISDWFLANPNVNDKTIASTMDQFKLTPADIARATGSNLQDVQSRYDATTAPVGGLPQTPPSNVLSGNIMAGASWNSLNPTLANDLTQATGLPTLNTAVGGATTADTLKQLDDFTNAGGTFTPGSNVFLQTGGIDLVSGLDRDTIQNNIEQIVSRLQDQGVNVVLTGSPYAASFEDVVSNNFNPELDQIYGNIANKYQNVSLVDTMGSILQNKDLLSDPIHPNAQGWEQYNKSVLGALSALSNRNRSNNQG